MAGKKIRTKFALFLSVTILPILTVLALRSGVSEERIITSVPQANTVTSYVPVDRQEFHFHQIQLCNLYKHLYTRDF